jgi:hypothetical protein
MVFQLQWPSLAERTQRPALPRSKENDMTEEITSTGVEKTTREPEVNVKADASWDDIPRTIKDRLACPPLLDHESEPEFFALFDSFRDYAMPENVIDYHLVFSLTVSKWEIIRYRFMATAVTSNQQQSGLESLFVKTHNAASIKGAEHLVKFDAAYSAKRCLSDAAYRDEAYCDLELKGFVPDGEAFLLSLPALATIERLLASAEKRFAATLKEIDRRLADGAAKRRWQLVKQPTSDQQTKH